MSATSKPLEVFRDLHLRGPATATAALHQALKDHAVSPWRHAAEKEAQLRVMGQEDDALAFERSATPGYEAAALVLVATSDGMEVANIVPRETSELSHRAYNAVLEDFAITIARPAASGIGFRVEVSNSTKQLDDELPPEVAESLRRFSVLANKSTGASHPLDRDRWFDFIILAHRVNASLDASMLARWLSECDGWPDRVAHDLAGEYERSRALLARLAASA